MLNMSNGHFLHITNMETDLLYMEPLSLLTPQRGLQYHIYLYSHTGRSVAPSEAGLHNDDAG